MLGFRSEQEVLQELRGSQTLTVAKLYHLCNILYHINDFHLFIKLQPVLRIIAELHRLANINHSFIRFYLSH